MPSLAQHRGTTSEPLTAGDVRAAHFAVVLGGYDMAEVDALLRQVARLLPERTPWEADPEPPAAGPGPALRGALRGYARDDVDDFLVRCAHSLRSRVRELPELAPLTARPRTGEPLTPREVETAQFSLVLRGYAPDAVDDLLDRVRALLKG